MTPELVISTGALRAAAVLAALAALTGCGRSPAGESAPPPPAMTVTAHTLSSTEIARSITANGTVHAWQEIVVGPEVGGYRVAAVHVDVGDRVRKGQELVRLADELLEADVASRRAVVQQARATLENASAALRRAEALAGSGALSASDLDRLSSEQRAAEAQLHVAQADLEAAELRLRYARVRAPDDGIISARSVSIGQIAQAGSEMLRLVRQGRVEWRAEIPEARLREIRPGQTVHLVTADGSQVHGKVRVVSPTVESSTRAGLVYVDLDAAAGARPGMFARGEIVLERSPANLVPLASVIIQDGYSYVFVLRDDDEHESTVERRLVETGAVNGRFIELLSGVAPGERVVEKGAGFLKDGDRVAVAHDTAGMEQAS
ncbi:MAG: efflux transporter periplasmic adaptor subunit [Proteobacteria bacterium]|nr:MAG: efflux transporter periplasmic adaptor subunit [Pseudomonadota bacterium]